MKALNPVLLLIFCTTILVQKFFPILGVAPNRMIQPIGLDYSDLYEHHALIVNVALQFFLLLSVLFNFNKIRLFLILLFCSLLISDLVFICADFAEKNALTNRIRFSLSSGFWMLVFLWFLMVIETLQQLTYLLWQKISLGMIIYLPIILLFLSNKVDHLSLVQEFHANEDVFRQAFVEHFTIVGLTLFFTLPIAIALGALCHSAHNFGRYCMQILGLIQTLPSIALFGLLLEPLSLLSNIFPFLSYIGIKGIGIAPAVIALVLYSLLPVVRSVLTGLNLIPQQTIDAALGLGMTQFQLLFQIKIPLALPIILSGIRIMVVQAIGLAMIAALIGAGGFGAIMFRGLANSALDLTLLGVIPVIILAMAVDMLFRLLETASLHDKPTIIIANR